MSDFGEARARDVKRGQIDHVGLHLWRTWRAFEAEKSRRLAARGFGDVLPADANLLPHFAIEGQRLADLARRMGVSKQAVHQGLQGLVQRDYVEVHADPTDRRARLVRYTPKGLRYVEAAQSVKRDMQRELASRLGARPLAELTRLLVAVEMAWTLAKDEAAERELA